MVMGNVSSVLGDLRVAMSSSIMPTLLDTHCLEGPGTNAFLQDPYLLIIYFLFTLVNHLQGVILAHS